MIESLTWWQFGLYWLLFMAAIVSLFSWLRSTERKRYDRTYRRYVDKYGTRLQDLEATVARPGHYVEFELDDGLPGHPRGVVWSHQQRVKYQAEQRRKILRIVQ